MAAVRPRAGSLVPWIAGAVALVLLHAASFARAQAQSPSLYAQATQATLDRSFPSPRVEYLLLDAASARPIAQRWADPDAPIPVGSLLKPFTALAYAGMNAGSGSATFPAIRCRGKIDGCWRARGHGALKLEQALAQSCNAYFLALASALAASPAGPDSLRRVATDYNLPSPPQTAPIGESGLAGNLPGEWIGVTPEWRIPPLALARAYAMLAGDPQDPVQSRLIAGMSLAAQPGGTASRAGHHPGGVLAKTGTAPCVPDSARCLANGDGLAILLAPATHPRLVLLVRQRGTTGAVTAELAGRMLTRIEEAHAP